MKSIFTISLLFTTVSVFGQSVELNGVEGDSLKFPAAVGKDGSLMYGSATIGDVTNHRFRILPNEKFSGRLQWDSSTGLFSLSGLKLDDSGVYKVQNTDQKINTVYQLKVYKDNVPVSKPHTSVIHDEYPCKLMCILERGTQATLSWYREGEKESYSSSSVRSAPNLDLPETVEKGGIYTCEARNSVSNETASITLGDHCTAPGLKATGPDTSSSVSTGSTTGIIIASAIAVVAVIIAIIFAVLYCRNRGDHTSVPTQA